LALRLGAWVGLVGDALGRCLASQWRPVCVPADSSRGRTDHAAGLPGRPERL